MGRKKPQAPVYHYTYSGRINVILASGTLLPPYLTPGFAAQVADAISKRMDINNPAWIANKKLLLFSQRTDWEPASFRGVINIKTGVVTDIIRLDDYAKNGTDVYRIAVDRSILHPYLKLLRLVKYPQAAAKRLAEIAREIGGNPYDWYGTPKPVPMDKWLSFEIYNPATKEWVQIPRYRSIELEEGDQGMLAKTT
jgi:hypothetical protein